MPNPGDIEFKYGRTYVYLNPNDAQGPGTWRTSNPDQISGGGGGGGGGGNYDFDGVTPVQVSQTPGVGANPTIVATSLDFRDLDNR